MLVALLVVVVSADNSKYSVLIKVSSVVSIFVTVASTSISSIPLAVVSVQLRDVGSGAGGGGGALAVNVVGDASVGVVVSQFEGVRFSNVSVNVLTTVACGIFSWSIKDVLDVFNVLTVETSVAVVFALTGLSIATTVVAVCCL